MAWGNGFWELVRFTLQMSMIIVGGFVLASSAPAGRLIGRLAAIPADGRSAVLAVALVAMLSSLLNWGFSLVFSALYAKAVARRRPDADYRALAAASFLGRGTVWAQGLSGSAALQMASETSMPKELFALVGTIPLSETSSVGRARRVSSSRSWSLPHWSGSSLPSANVRRTPRSWASTWGRREHRRRTRRRSAPGSCWRIGPGCCCQSWR